MSITQLVHAVQKEVKRRRLLELPEVETICRIKKSTIYRLMAMTPPQFPHCVRITARCVAWPEDRIWAWVEDRIAAADQQAAAFGSDAAAPAAPAGQVATEGQQ